MRIALVIEELDPARGGVEQWSWQFSQHLLAQGHEVHVVARRAAESRPQGLVVHPLGPVGSRCRFAQAAEQALAQLKFDVVHDTGCGWQCDVFQPHGGSRRASFRRNQALVHPWLRPARRQLTGLLPRYREFESLARRQYRDDGRLFLALSWMVAGDLVRDYALPPERIRLVYNGVDIERYSPAHQANHRAATRAQLGISQDEVLLLIIAHNFRLKGVPTLLHAVQRLRAAGYAVRLAVAGGDSARGRYAAWLKRQGLHHTVRLLGPVADPVPLYAAADLYVQPTFYDPCSLVALEALASGLPVITTRYNGVGELIQPGIQGDVVDDPADDLLLAKAIEPLLDPVRRRPMAAAARELALAHDLQRNYREILAVYQEARPANRQAA